MTPVGFPLCCRDDMSSRQVINALTWRYDEGSKWLMRRCSELAGSGFAVVALKAVPHDPAREEGTRELTDVWEGED